MVRRLFFFAPKQTLIRIILDDGHLLWLEDPEHFAVSRNTIPHPSASLFQDSLEMEVVPLFSCLHWLIDQIANSFLPWPFSFVYISYTLGMHLHAAKLNFVCLLAH